MFIKTREKIVDLNIFSDKRKKFKEDKKKVVWTNGCFDIIHAGHIETLEKAKEFGDILVVGINSDSSVKKLKGSFRPICCQDDRARVVAACGVVDYVVIFDNIRCNQELMLLKPDIWVKAGDYSLESLDTSERQAIESYGGIIEFSPYIPTLSSSILIEKINKL